MIVLLFTILRIMFGDMFRRYVHMRKKAHISITLYIWAMEILAIATVHEMVLHIAIPTAVAIHESMVIVFAEE